MERNSSGQDITAWLLAFYGQVGFFAWKQRIGTQTRTEPTNVNGAT